MTGEHPDVPTDVPPPAATAVQPRRSRLPWLFALLAFILGGAAVFAALPLVERWRAAQPVQSVAQLPVQAPAPATGQVTLEGLAAREAVLDAQLRIIEGRMASVDGASRTAAGYATRAEAMMLAFAARRALDRGLALGYLEPQLRARFGADQPDTVATIINAARTPVTLEDLREGLEINSARLTAGTTREGVWPAVRRELADLIVVRRETTPSPRPIDRLERARRMLDAGQVEGALAEVARLPGAAEAESWMDAAKRYIDARRALVALEQVAITGQSQPVAQTPSR